MVAGSSRSSRSITAAVSHVLRTAPICVPIAIGAASPAVAQAIAPATLAAEIPAQPLKQALASFASQTGWQLVYVSDVVRNQKSRGAPAGMSPQEALARLLQGTGLRFEYLTPRSVRILAVPPPRPAAGFLEQEVELSEVIVTASRREERLQDVPITIQVMTETTLRQLNATTFDDFIRYLPGITAHGIGPSQNFLYSRGLGTGESGVWAVGFAGSFPNVAVYLDEQSAQLPGRNLDVYAADLQHIEVLEGPQGTLFGAGAEAGVLRYITNKPKLNVTEGTLTASYSTTARGSPGNAMSAVLNLPLIDDRLAIRGVIYRERRGGYIDNTPATFARDATDLGIQYIESYTNGVPPQSVTINNFNIAGHDFNPVTYNGVRAEVLYQFNDDWRVLLAQSYQSIDAEGVSTEMAANALGQPQPDLSVQLFNPSFNKDQFEDTALTVEGTVAGLKMLYTGSYLVRNIEQLQDYTSYTRGGTYVDYYQCVPPEPTPERVRCFSPSSYWRNLERNTHQSHELRLSTSADRRLRGIGGLFYENNIIQDQIDWFYLTALPYFSPVAPPTGYYAVNGSALLPDGEVVCRCTSPNAMFVPGAPAVNNPNVRPPGDAFFNDVKRGYKQKAVYASVDYELLPHVLTMTAGTRYSSINTWQAGATVNSFGCEIENNPPNPCRNVDFTNLNALGLSRTYSGFQSRANLSWDVGGTAVIYYTWSQGFRAGGFNRGFAPPYTSPLATPQSVKSFPPNEWQTQAYVHGGWVPPLGFAPDTLTNNELGWKVNWQDQRLQWNGAIYQENWNHIQSAGLDAGVLGGSQFNGGDYRVRGLETTAELRPVTGLTLSFGAAWNHSELIKEAPFYWQDGTPINFNILHTAYGQKLSNPAGVLGSPLAGAPAFQGNVRVRYEFALGPYGLFAQMGAVHQSHSLASTDRLSFDQQNNSTAYDLAPFTIIDAALGVLRDGWLLQLSGENLTDTRAEQYANYRAYYKAVTVNRPRTVSLRLTYRFGGA